MYSKCSKIQLRPIVDTVTTYAVFCRYTVHVLDVHVCTQEQYICSLLPGNQILISKYRARREVVVSGGWSNGSGWQQTTTTIYAFTCTTGCDTMNTPPPHLESISVSLSLLSDHPLSITLTLQLSHTTLKTLHQGGSCERDKSWYCNNSLSKCEELLCTRPS